jgi:hypothetical protein
MTSNMRTFSEQYVRRILERSSHGFSSHPVTWLPLLRKPPTGLFFSVSFFWRKCESVIFHTGGSFATHSTANIRYRLLYNPTASVRCKFAPCLIIPANVSEILISSTYGSCLYIMNYKISLGKTFALLGCYAAQVCSCYRHFGTTFRSHLQLSSLTLEDGT